MALEIPEPSYGESDPSEGPMILRVRRNVNMKCLSMGEKISVAYDTSILTP